MLSRVFYVFLFRAFDYYDSTLVLGKPSSKTMETIKQDAG